MNDDQVRDELLRRSQSAAFLPDELLPSVRAAYASTSVAPARSARWAPLAGLAATTVIVLALVVARPQGLLTGASVPPSPSRSPSSSASLSSGQIRCGSDTAVAITDLTGLIVSCHALTDFNQPLDQGVTVYGKDVDVYWRNEAWWSIVNATFEPHDGGYTLAILAQSPPVPSDAPSPAGPLLPMHLTLHLSAAIVGPIAATLNGEPLLTSTPPRTAPPRTGVVTFDCGDSISLVDTSRQVVDCSNGTVRDYHTAHSGVAAVARPNALTVTWGNNFCARSQQIEVSETPIGGSFTYNVSVVPTSFDPLCMGHPDAHSADIEFSMPVDPAAVALNVDPRVVSCDATESLARHIGQVSIYDGTGLIQSCLQRSADQNSKGDTASNPQPDQLLVRWTDEAGPGSVPITFNDKGDHFELASADFCHSCAAGRFEILMQLSRPIALSDLWLGLDGRPLVPAAAPPPSSSAPSAR